MAGPDRQQDRHHPVVQQVGDRHHQRQLEQQPVAAQERERPAEAAQVGLLLGGRLRGHLVADRPGHHRCRYPERACVQRDRLQRAADRDEHPGDRRPDRPGQPADGAVEAGQLPLSDHVHRLDTRQQGPRAAQRLETQHWPSNTLEGTMVLLDNVIHMWTTPACKGFRSCFGDMVRCSHMSGLLVRCV